MGSVRAFFAAPVRDLFEGMDRCLEAGVRGLLWITAGLIAAAAPALAQTPTIGPQIRVDLGGGTAAANEMSAAASSTNPNEIVASWNDWRESGGFEVIRIGAALSLDGGETWSDLMEGIYERE